MREREGVEIACEFDTAPYRIGHYAHVVPDIVHRASHWRAVSSLQPSNGIEAFRVLSAVQRSTHSREIHNFSYLEP